MYGAAESSSTGAHNSRAHYQDLSREHDRLRMLFDITNALVSELGRDELFDAISEPRFKWQCRSPATRRAQLQRQEHDQT